MTPVDITVVVILAFCITFGTYKTLKKMFGIKKVADDETLERLHEINMRMAELSYQAWRDEGKGRKQ
jgi:hypothetical protein